MSAKLTQALGGLFTWLLVIELLLIGLIGNYIITEVSHVYHS